MNCARTRSSRLCCGKLKFDDDEDDENDDDAPQPDSFMQITIQSAFQSLTLLTAQQVVDTMLKCKSPAKKKNVGFSAAP